MDFVERLRSLRNDHVDEIPRDVVNYGNYKVRAIWFTGVMYDLEYAVIKRKITDPRVVDKIETFLDKHNQTWDPEKMTTTDEIDEANKLIDLALNSLKGI